MTTKNYTSLTALMLSALWNQHALNQVKDKNWVDAPYSYGFAVAKECMELADHTNWNWYGKHSADFDKPLTPRQLLDIHIELSDIMHFGLSMAIRQNAGASLHVGSFDTHMETAAIELRDAYIKDQRRRARETVNEKKIDGPFDEVRQELIRRTAVALGAKATGLNAEFSFDIFFDLCNMCGLSQQGLMSLYFGKTALNKFRWANGYGDGSYHKMWLDSSGDRVEDNIIMALEVASPETLDLPYQNEMPILQLIANGDFEAALLSRFRSHYQNSTDVPFSKINVS